MDINEKTKLKIAYSMKELMEHSSLSKISVKDLVDAAHLTRQTFY